MFSRLFRKKSHAPTVSVKQQARVVQPEAAAPQPVSVAEALQTAFRLHGEGRYDEARRICEEMLAGDPENSDALHLLGIFAQHRGEISRAIELLSQAVTIEPRNPIALNNLAVMLQQQGKLAEAVSCYEDVLRLKPDFAAAHNNLGNVKRDQGRWDEALACYEKALLLDSTLVETLTSKAEVLRRQGRLEEAVACYREAIRRRPESADIYCSLANTLFALDIWEEARECYERALTLNPNLAAAHNNLGNMLRQEDRFDEALACYRKALSLDPRNADIHCNMGLVHRCMQQLDLAVTSYQRALDFRPESADAYCGLGRVLTQQGGARQAASCFEKALTYNPDSVGARWARVVSELHPVYESLADVARQREIFSHELDNLLSWSESNKPKDAHEAVGVYGPFFLAYQEESNKELLAKHGRLCADVMRTWQEREGLGSVQVEPAHMRDRVRVGIVSSHIRNHSEWYAIVKGWVQYLDPTRFELYVYHLCPVMDEQTAFARSRAACFEQGFKGLHEWIGNIRAQQPDILIYPELGTESIQVKLASLRLAPIQMVAWGYPETSGLPTMDYYLSAEDFEPSGAQCHYTEKLVTLPHLGCTFERFSVPSTDPDLAGYGITPDYPTLICAGRPYKYMPQHDWIWAEIAGRLERCRLVFFFSDEFPYWVKTLRGRLELAFRQRGLDLDQHVVFLPSLPRSAFFGLMKRADLFLDTIGFSGFNTAMQAVECGLPIVTREGRFMRGRFASGILKRMGMADQVARTDDEYVERTVNLVQDGAYREAVRRRMQSSHEVLFGDVAPVKALEELMLLAVECSRAQSATAANAARLLQE